MQRLDREQDMSEKELDAKAIEEKVHDLAQSMERVREAQASRDDVVVDMLHAKTSRLKLLADDLQGVFEDIPAGNEQFEFALTNGETPRLWIDMTAFVRMGRDEREYEFVKDTRLGRTILGKSPDKIEIGKHVTDYVAERILEREQMLEGDWVSAKSSTAAMGDKNSGSANSKKRSAWAGMLWFAFGLVAGVALLLGLAWYDQLAPLIQRFVG